jgi:hypothetical protein
MSRRANITELLVVTMAAVMLGCGTNGSSGAQEPVALMRIEHCVGDVVPLCASVRVTEAGRIQYARRGKRTLKAQLPGHEAAELRQEIGALNVAGWSNNDDPIGSFVTLETAAGKRTFAISDIPGDAVSVLQLVDREGRRLFGAAYRPIREAR